jgi:CO/xanthine dehydrogenase Mo-binding subunit
MPLGGAALCWEVSLATAQVEVDEDTGPVQLQKYVSIADVNKAIHPRPCEAQEEGGVMMGIGHTLFEHMVCQDGQLPRQE